jgi:hypothetical protein
MSMGDEGGSPVTADPVQDGPGQPDWVIDFDVENDKVTTMLLRNTKIRCKR